MTVTASSTTSDRRLLADINRWLKANGWTRDWRGVRINPDRTLGIDICDGSDGMGTGFRLMRGDLLHKPTEYAADSVRQAVDLLVALDILPVRFSSLASTMRRLADEMETEAAVHDAPAGSMFLDAGFRIRQTIDGEYEPTGDPR